MPKEIITGKRLIEMVENREIGSGQKFTLVYTHGTKYSIPATITENHDGILVKLAEPCVLGWTSSIYASKYGYGCKFWWVEDEDLYEYALNTSADVLYDRVQSTYKVLLGRGY